MNRSIKLVIFALILGSLFILGSPVWAQDINLRPLKETAHVPGELLVKFRKGASQASINSMHALMGSTVIKEHKAIGIQHIKLREGMTVEAAQKAYGANPDVVYAEPNHLYHTKESFSDDKLRDSKNSKVHSHGPHIKIRQLRDDMGDNVTFVLLVDNFPNQIKTLGFDAVTDPKVLKYSSFTRGELVKKFDVFSVCRLKPSRLRVGGFEAGQDLIGAGKVGEIVQLHFQVIGKGELTLEMENLKDDIRGGLLAD